jgi:hypothetical protein
MPAGKAALKSLYNQAGFEELAVGRAWYSQAYSCALGLAQKYKLTIAQTAGVISVLSPYLDWDQNLAAAEIVCQQGPKVDPSTVIVPGFNRNKLKAFAIVRTSDLGQVKGPKVTAFFQCILGRRDLVVVDRWAYRIWCGEPTNTSLQPPNLTKALLTRIYSDYHLAAAQVGEQPTDLQAITWVVARRLNKLNEAA